MADNLLPGRYAVGAASIDAGGTVVTPTGATWTDNVWGDDLFFLPSQPLVPPQRVESVNEDGEIVLAYPWPGAAATEEPYEVRYVGIIERSTAQSRRVLEQLGDVKSWADIFVPTNADRLALESPSNPLPAGRRVLVIDGGLIWVKKSSAYDDWLPPAEFQGPQGNPGPYTNITFGAVTTGAAGTPASVSVVEVDDETVRLDFTLPKGADGTGTGDMVGPPNSADDEIVVFSGTTGKLTKRGGKTIAEIASTGSVPLGTPMPVITNILPGGYLWLEGGTYDPLVYPEFAAYMVSGGYVSGQLPDWRNRVPRGLGGLTGAVGTTQEDDLKAHGHNLSLSGMTTQPLSGSGQGTISYGNGPAINQSNTPGNRSAAGDGLGAVWPTGGSETRVKAFIVRWAVKAYGAITDAGSADLVAIEQAIANGMIRKDADQNAQALSAAFKINILKNTLQAWEQIGSEIVVGTAVAQIDWTGLGAYKRLRLSGRYVSTVADAQLAVRMGAGTIDASATYSFEVLAGKATTAVAAQATGVTYGAITFAVGINNSGYASALELTIHDFNTAARMTRYNCQSSCINQAPEYAVSFYGGIHGALTADDQIRLLCTGGNIGVGSSFILEGVRG